MGFFKNLAKVFVDFEDDNVPETKEDVEKALKDIQEDKPKKSRDKRNIFKTTTSSDKRESILELDDVFLSNGLEIEGTSNNIYKVFEILQSPQLKGLDAKTVKTAVLLNLEMNKIPINDLIKDGQKRLDVLEKYEEEKIEDIRSLTEEIDGKNKLIQEEINAYLEQKKAEISENNNRIEQIKQKLEEWTKVKDEELEGLKDLINYLSKK